MSETATPPGRWARLKGWQQVVVTLVGCALVSGAFLIVGDRLGLLDEGGQPDEAGAQDVCEQFVEKRLKSPSSAEFGDSTMVATDGKRWTVDGDVDAENSFGATIRNHYTCTVTPTDPEGTNWDLVDLELTEP